MVKVKNKKQKLCENVNSNRDSNKNKKSLNQFEVHINKEKLRVLGRKLKNDRGLPGIARSKARQKRIHTLLPEYIVQNKSNKFVDKRIGERNQGISSEDKTIARYTAERVKHHNKKSIFNLADDEILTHKGQTLSEIEKFDDPRSDDEESLDGHQKTGDLERKFVQDAHFGGGMLRKSDGAKSHKELIDQLIFESKKRKAEKQKQKEATTELTEKLDTEWKDLLPIVNNSKKQKHEEVKTKVDAYDRVMRELKFEARGIPSDKLKDKDEVAKEEKEKLENLERERLERMKGTIVKENIENIENHRSADDLDDMFAHESDLPDITLSYDDGKSNIEIPNNDIANQTESDKGSENGEEASAVEEEDEEESDKDSLSDLKENYASESDEDLEATQNNVNLEIEAMDVIVSSENIKIDLMKRKEIMDIARKELPYTFVLPENYEALKTCLKEQSSCHQGIIIERMIKCNHPSLKEGNKQALDLLFVYIIQHINDIFIEAKCEDSIKESFKVFSCLTPHLFDLAQMNQENAHTTLLEVMRENHADFTSGGNKFPHVFTLIVLKLVSCLFSTSDFRNQVVTPCMIFMEQILTTCKVRTRKDIAYGLFIISIIAEFTSFSKRYSPVAITFLSGVLHMAIPKSGVQLIKVLPPFKPTCTSLVLNNIIANIPNVKLDVSDLISKNECDDTFRIKAIHVTTGLLKSFYNNFNTLPSCPDIFELSRNYLEKIPTINYPSNVVTQMLELKNLFEECGENRTLEFLVMGKRRPKALRLYEPNIVRVYDGKTHKVQSREKSEQDKLLHKFKREQKGAVREIRRDQSFLGRIKIDHKIRSDQERHQKVRQIMTEANVQQCELNTMDRKNSSKKKNEK